MIRDQPLLASSTHKHKEMKYQNIFHHQLNQVLYNAFVAAYNDATKYVQLTAIIRML